MSLVSTCERNTPDWLGPPDDKPASVDDAIAHINQWYDAGVPFFTKESIREVAEQLGRPRGEQIVVKGVDGNKVAFDVIIGKTRDGFDDDGECVEYESCAPFIGYQCPTHLKQHLNLGFISLREAYCTLPIRHWTIQKHKDTKEPVFRRDALDHNTVSDFFMQKIQPWQESDMCKDLVCILVKFASTFEIKKIVAFACGPMSLGDRVTITSRSVIQHALLLTVRNWTIKKAGDENVTCFAQEPLYTSIDKSVLKESNIHAVDDPQAFLEVDDESVIFSCSPNIPVKEIVTDLARPAVLIWDRVSEKDEEGGGCTDPDSSRVKAMIRDHYDQYDFCSDHDHFSDIAIYIRRHDTPDCDARSNGCL